MPGRHGFDMDAGKASAALGSIAGLTAGLSQKRTLNSFVKYSHAYLAQRFNEYLDGVATSNPESLHHVYEWSDETDWTDNKNSNHAGKTRRLWRHTLTGKEVDKTASFYFIASVKPVPVHPVLTIPNESTGKYVKEGVHVFTLKAEVMEAGLNVTITPKFAKALAYYNEETDDIAFSAGQTLDPGGGETTGAFTAHYAGWWETEGQEMFESQIVPKLSRDLFSEEELSLGQGVSTRTPGPQAYKEAEKKAKEKLKSKAGKYDRGANARLQFVNSGMNGEFDDE